MRLNSRVRIEKLKNRIKYIAGVDVGRNQTMLFGAVVVLSFPELQILESTWAKVQERLPYIPGYLSFREVPVILRAYKKLKRRPELILVDGQGIAHPRRFGLATHLGVLLDLPTIGCAKSHLWGDYQMPALRRGSFEFLRFNGERIGLVLRTRDGVKPLFVSPGHRVDFEDCRDYVLNSTTRYRIPEPLRQAHRLATERARGWDV